MKGETLLTKLWKAAARLGAAAFVAALLCLSPVPAGAGLTKTGPGRLVLTSGVVVGLLPGQTARVNVSNPCGPEEGDGSVRAHVKVFDGAGALLFRTEETDIRAGGFRSFDVNRDDIARTGDPRTGRLEVRVELFIKAAPPRGGGADGCAGHTYVNQGVLQLIKNDSGETTVALLLPAVQKVREAAARASN